MVSQNVFANKMSCCRSKLTTVDGAFRPWLRCVRFKTNSSVHGLVTKITKKAEVRKLDSVTFEWYQNFYKIIRIGDIFILIKVCSSEILSSLKYY